VKLPVLFRVGYSRGRLVIYAPALFLAAGVWLSQTFGLFDADSVGTIPPTLAVGCCIAIGMVGIVIGTAVAIRMYASKDLR